MQKDIADAFYWNKLFFADHYSVFDSNGNTLYQGNNAKFVRHGGGANSYIVSWINILGETESVEIDFK